MPTKTKATGPIGPKPPLFSKQNILTFSRYAKRRDLLKAILEDGKQYTTDQVDHLIENFMKKGKVK